MRHHAYLAVNGIGLGHAMRSMILAKKLLSKGWRVTISTYGDGIEAFLSKGYKVNLVPKVSYEWLEGGRVSIRLTMAKNLQLPVKVALQVAKEFSFIERSRADVIISDTRASSILAANALNIPSVAILNQFNLVIDPSGHETLATMAKPWLNLVPKVWGMAEAIAVTDFPPPYTISSRNLLIPKELQHKVHMVGPIVGCDHEHASLGNLLSKDITIMVHISGPSVERHALASILIPILKKIPDYTFIVTLGNPGSKRFVEMDNVLIYDWIEDACSVMGSCSLVIGRAGHGTVCKALSLGKPLIVIPTPGQTEQEGNAASVERNKVGIMIRQDDVTKDRLVGALESLLNDKSYTSNAKRYAELVDRLNPVGRIMSIVDRVARGTG